MHFCFLLTSQILILPSRPADSSRWPVFGKNLHRQQVEERPHDCKPVLVSDTAHVSQIKWDSVLRFCKPDGSQRQQISNKQ